MALVSLLLNNSKDRTAFRENNSDLDILLVDVTTSRTTNYENEMTLFPVEDGPDITDHIRTKPITMNIEGIISETPLSLEAQKASLVTSGTSFVNKSLGGFKGASAITGAAGGKLGAKLFQSGGSPAELGRKALEDLIIKKQRIRVAVGKKILDNMVVTRLSIPEDNQIGRALKFSATLQQIRVVTGETVLIAKIARSAAHTAGKKTNLGGQATTEATKPQARSALKYIFGGSK